jgi:hypothetical protein
MSNEDAFEMAVMEGANYLEKHKLTTETVIKLMHIGFCHGAEWKAGEVQSIISRLEGIEIDLEPDSVVLFSDN